MTSIDQIDSISKRSFNEILKELFDKIEKLEPNGMSVMTYIKNSFEIHHMFESCQGHEKAVQNFFRSNRLKIESLFDELFNAIDVNENYFDLMISFTKIFINRINICDHYYRIFVRSYCGKIAKQRQKDIYPSLFIVEEHQEYIHLLEKKCIDILIKIIVNNNVQNRFVNNNHIEILDAFYEYELHKCVNYCIDKFVENNIVFSISDNNFMINLIDFLYNNMINKNIYYTNGYCDYHLQIYDQIIMIKNYFEHAKGLQEFVESNQTLIFKIMRICDFNICDRNEEYGEDERAFKDSPYYDEIMYIIENILPYTSSNVEFVEKFNGVPITFNIITYSIFLKFMNLTEYLLNAFMKRGDILNINIMNTPIFGMTPLMYAIQHNFDVSIIENLIHYCECDYNYINDDNENAIIIAANVADRTVDYYCVSFLLSFNDLNVCALDENSNNKLILILKSNIQRQYDEYYHDEEYSHCRDDIDNLYDEVEKLIDKIKFHGKMGILRLHNSIIEMEPENTVINNTDINHTNMNNMNIDRFIGDQYWMRELLTYVGNGNFDEKYVNKEYVNKELSDEDDYENDY